MDKNITSGVLFHSELGKKSEYESHYNSDKLFPIARKEKRDEIGVPTILPFNGIDLWNHYEVSWLNEKGKPVVALAEIMYDCNTPYIIESKSMKLYFNSLNNTQFQNAKVVEEIIQNDIAEKVGGPVTVNIKLLSSHPSEIVVSNFEGICIDDADIDCSVYTIDTSFLTVQNEIVEEVLCSNLLKSNCLVTHQPDWGSVQISYHGRKINREGLLRYIVSFRNHNEFHEQCVERIFIDIMHHCQPEALTVYARYTRRGGVDINPYRTTEKTNQVPQNRLLRQ